MSHRPYPSRKRALHQLDRHAYEYRPYTSPAAQTRAAILRAYRLPPRLLGLPPGWNRPEMETSANYTGRGLNAYLKSPTA